MTPREAIQRVRERWAVMSEMERLHWLGIALAYRRAAAISVITGRPLPPEWDGYRELHDEIVAHACTLTPQDGEAWIYWREHFC